MISLPNISTMEFVEYVDHLESTALYTGVSAHELNMEYHMEIGIVDMETYERAKWELYERAREIVYS